MEAAVIDGGEVGGGDSAISVTVKFTESLVNDTLPLFVGAAADSHKELVVVNSAVLVGVEGIDQDFSLALGDVHAHVFDSPVELLLVEFAVAVNRVHDSEGSAHATDGLGAAGRKSAAHFRND